MLTILSSVRSLFRGFRSSPGFLVVVLFTLAVGIGATAAIFTVVNAVLIRPLPYPEPERLVEVWNRAPGMHLDQFEHSGAAISSIAGTTTCWRTWGSTVKVPSP